MNIERRVEIGGRFGRPRIVNVTTLEPGHSEVLSFGRYGNKKVKVLEDGRLGVNGGFIGSAWCDPAGYLIINLEADRRNRLTGTDNEGRRVVFQSPTAPDNSLRGKAISRIVAAINKLTHQGK